MRSFEDYQSRHSRAAIRHVDVFKRRLRMRKLKKARADLNGSGWFAGNADDLAFVQREMVRGLRMFLEAPDGLAACGALVLNPLLLPESGRERLKRTLAMANVQENEARKQLVEERLAMLELACAEGIIAVVRKLTQP